MMSTCERITNGPQGPGGGRAISTLRWCCHDVRSGKRFISVQGQVMAAFVQSGQPMVFATWCILRVHNVVWACRWCRRMEICPISASRFSLGPGRRSEMRKFFCVSICMRKCVRRGSLHEQRFQAVVDSQHGDVQLPVEWTQMYVNSFCDADIDGRVDVA